MENQHFNNDFEKFLQQQTRMHRMYPSDAVWKGIYKQLHGHRTWPGLNFFAILIIAALTVCTVLTDDKSIVHVQNAVKHQPNKTGLAFTSIADQLNPAKAVNSQKFNSINRDLIFGEKDEASTIVPESIAPDNDERNTFSSVVPLVNTSITAIGANSERSASEEIIDNEQQLEKTLIIKANDNDVSATIIDEIQKEALEASPVVKELAHRDDNEMKEQTSAIVALPKTNGRASRWGLQFYITPSASFRELASSKPSSSNAPAANTNAIDVNNAVKHRPGMGTEIGAAVSYQLTNNFRIKSGLQLNIRQYNIAAYYSGLEVTAIALVRGNSVDTLHTYAMYRNQNGNMATELVNKYYQVAMPIGIEYDLVNRNNFGFAVGATLQPTYTFTPGNSYMISTDLKNYANGKTLLRNWNVNSTLEAIVRYQTGKLEWRLAPQVRYQHLPTYSKPYPIREYLIDYGVKIGFVKSL